MRRTIEVIFGVLPYDQAPAHSFWLPRFFINFGCFLLLELGLLGETTAQHTRVC